MSNTNIVIGIDPGVHTGICVYRKSEKKIVDLRTTDIADAMMMVVGWHADCGVTLYIEDARTRSGSKEKALGAGSVRRDCSVWQSWCDYHKIPVVWKRVGTTKVGMQMFDRLTGYRGRSSSHARDAAMIVWGM